jgi:hypothetical protein
MRRPFGALAGKTLFLDTEEEEEEEEEEEPHRTTIPLRADTDRAE